VLAAGSVSPTNDGAVFVRYETRLKGKDGLLYTPQVSGEPEPDGKWRGWVEFAATSGTAIVFTTIETVQPNRQAVIQWARGLPTTDLENALAEATSAVSD
jgi:hypothetical protein